MENKTLLETIFGSLKDGKMPEVEVEVSLKQSSMIEFFAGLFFSAVAIVIAIKIVNTIK